jgi:hypothetical protein
MNKLTITGTTEMKKELNSSLLGLNTLILKKSAEIIKSDIVDNTTNRKWKSIPKAIKLREINSKEIDIYINGEKTNEIASYQHYGTVRHFIAPVRANALHWNVDGTDYFSKGHFVSGIKPTNFFAVSQIASTKIDEIIKAANI